MITPSTASGMKKTDNISPNHDLVCVGGLCTYYLNSRGEMCNVVKNNYGDDNGGFIGGQVYRNAGFISEEGSVGADASHKEPRIKQNMGDIVIVTYWKSFEQHEKSHADKLFKEKFSQLAAFCDDTCEVGYEMLWQGVPEDH